GRRRKPLPAANWRTPAPVRPRRSTGCLRPLPAGGIPRAHGARGRGYGLPCREYTEPRARLGRPAATDWSGAALDVVHRRRHADAPFGNLRAGVATRGLEQQHAVASAGIGDAQVRAVGVLVRPFLDPSRVEALDLRAVHANLAAAGRDEGVAIGAE